VTWITKDQLLGFVNWLVTAACGYALSKGWLAADDTAVVASIAAGIVTLGWQFYQRTSKRMIERTSELPDVQHIIVSPLSSVSRSSDKVVIPAEYAAIQAAADAATSGRAILY
jgi:hypothetical protein